MENFKENKITKVSGEQIPLMSLKNKSNFRRTQSISIAQKFSTRQNTEED